MPTRRHPIAEKGPLASGPAPDRHGRDEDEDQRDRAEGGIADGPHDAARRRPGRGTRRRR